MKSKAQWKATALKIINKARAANLMISCTFSLAGGYDPVTEVDSAATTEAVDCLREEYKAGQIDGQAIQSNDFKLLALGDEFLTIYPKTAGLTVTVDGKVCTVVSASIDPADALWIIQVRG